MTRGQSVFVVLALFSISLGVASIARQIERQTTVTLCIEMMKLGGECEALK